MSCNNWNNGCNCSCNCPGGYSNAGNYDNKCSEKNSDVSDASTGNGNMNMCYRKGYAEGFKAGYETGFRDGFWTASGCGRTYGGNVMGSYDYGCGCK